jgi:signal transduction histidine kinase/CheY-like chemotaxis protein
VPPIGAGHRQVVRAGPSPADIVWVRAGERSTADPGEAPVGATGAGAGAASETGTPRPGPWATANRGGLAAGFMVVYAVAVLVGRMSRLPGTSLALVWPAAAVGFVWLLWASSGGRRFLVGNALALAGIAALLNRATGAAPTVAVALGVANVLQAGVECVLLSRLRPDAWQLRRPADLAVWIGACVTGALAGAVLGPLVLVVGTGGNFWEVAGAWTLRNATNTFVFGALALRLAADGLRSLVPPAERALELLAAIVVLTSAYAVVFGLADGLPLAYLVLPLSMWISLRFSTSLAAALVLLVAVLVVCLTMAGRGPFAAITPATRVLLAQAFVAVVGIVTLVLALHRDERQALMHDLRQARARSEEQARQLEIASRLKSEFLTTMSHEIRTPLNGVLGFTALLAQSPGDPGAAEWATAADTAGRSLLSIVNNSLDLAKIEAGGVELESIEFDLVALAREAMLPSQLAARDAGIDLRLLVGDGLHGTRRGDPVRLRQILTNLVSNAVKFTPKGSVTLSLAPGPGGPAGLTLRVIDTGIGMSAVQQQRLFTPFSQAAADTTRRYGGTGLGLSIAQGLVTLLGGRISVVSTADVGTTFTVDLELEPVTERALQTSLDEPVPDRPAGPGPTRVPDRLDGAEPGGPDADQGAVRVLVAEDNVVNQMVAKATLRTRGLLVDVVGDGAQAVEAALSGRYAAVFMDCQMPVMDGLEATSRIRARESGTPDAPRIPVIAMTAGAFEEDRAACLAAGMDDFLPKPWKREELAEVLARLGIRAPSPRPELKL